jgi:hypothetical protein
MFSGALTGSVKLHRRESVSLSVKPSAAMRRDDPWMIDMVYNEKIIFMIRLGFLRW